MSPAVTAAPSPTGRDDAETGHPPAIVPSMLDADFGRLADEVRSLEAAGADRLQFDVMDGHFVPALTHGAAVLASVRAETGLTFEAHLMIEGPETMWRSFAEAGADVIIVHAEATAHLHQLLSDIRMSGCRAGVALNPATPLQSVADAIEAVDLLLIMTVNPGRGGQQLIPAMVDKVGRARVMLDRARSTADLEVDGGVSEATIPALVKHGATVLVAGSSIHRHPAGRAPAIAALRAAAGSTTRGADPVERGVRHA